MLSFGQMSSIILNGKIHPAGQPLLLPDNKGYRYGDGIFETIRIIQGKILFEQAHFDRFFNSLATLEMQLPRLVTQSTLRVSILRLAEKNNASELGRVRLSAFRGNGGLLEGSDEAHYLLEAWPLAPSQTEWNVNGLTIGIFPNARKSCDPYAAIKSANFLPYTLAGRYAKTRKWNDALVLNTSGRIADSTIANIFIVSDEVVVTPPISEGCIEGVMRNFVIAWCRKNGLKVEEKAVTIGDLHSAGEVFLTNVIRGIRWVKEADGHTFTNQFTQNIRQQIDELILA